MIELKPHNLSHYGEWLESALKDDEIWPFMSSTPGQSYKVDVLDDWNEAHFMSDNRVALASLHFDRKRRSARLSSFSLAKYGTRVKRISAYELFSELFGEGYAFLRFGFDFLDLSVHSTNTECLRFLRRVESWGTEPQGLYDKKLGCWVDGHHFRIMLSDVILKAPARFHKRG